MLADLLIKGLPPRVFSEHVVYDSWNIKGPKRKGFVSNQRGML